jgi:hypothetical protein
MPALGGPVHRLYNKKWGRHSFASLPLVPLALLLCPATMRSGQDLVRAALASSLRGAREARLFVQSIKAPPYFQR